MWEKHVSKNSGKTYYFNRATGQSVYERPADYDSERNSGDGNDSKREKRKHGDDRRKDDDGERRKDDASWQRKADGGSSSSGDGGGGGGGSSSSSSGGSGSSSISSNSGGSRARSSTQDNDNGGDAKRIATGGGKTLTTSHLLVKHAESRKPVSWRSPEGIKRTKKEARAKAERLLAKLKTYDAEHLPKYFAKMAQHDSDCSSAKAGGGLGEWTTGRKKFMPEFEVAAAPLAVGELSGIAETSSGFHIILRTK
jgi:hypothetical protein